MWRTRLCLMLAVLPLAGGCANGLFYQPSQRAYSTPRDHGANVTPVTFHSADGTALQGWFLPAAGVPIGTIVHFHGNAQNLSAHVSYVDWLTAEGFNVFVFDYRGYGASEGHPSRRGVHADGAAALQYVSRRPDVDPNRLVVIGQSLGGATAVAVLGRQPWPGVRALVLDSSFASYRGIVRDKLRLIPVLSLIRWPLSFLVVSNHNSPDRWITHLPPIPILVIAGTDDPIVPYAHGAALYERAHPPKTLWTVPHGQHTDAFMRHAPVYRPALVQFLKSALADSPPPP